MRKETAVEAEKENGLKEMEEGETRATIEILMKLSLFMLLIGCATPKEPITIPHGHALTLFRNESYRIWPANKARHMDGRDEVAGSLYNP